MRASFDAAPRRGSRPSFSTIRRTRLRGRRRPASSPTRSRSPRDRRGRSSTTSRTATSSSTGASRGASSPSRVRATSASSCSRCRRATGWRAGGSASSSATPSSSGGSRPLQDHVRAGMFTPVQEAAIAALSGPQDTVVERTARYEARRDRVVARVGRPRGAVRGHVLRVDPLAGRRDGRVVARGAPARGRAGEGLRAERRRCGAALGRAHRRVDRRGPRTARPRARRIGRTALAAVSGRDHARWRCCGASSSFSPVSPSCPPSRSRQRKARSRMHGAVTNVVDGDTVDVRLDGGKLERVRLIGLDTPEAGTCRRVGSDVGSPAARRAGESRTARRCDPGDARPLRPSARLRLAPGRPRPRLPPAGRRARTRLCLRPGVRAARGVQARRGARPPAPPDLRSATERRGLRPVVPRSVASRRRRRISTAPTSSTVASVSSRPTRMASMGTTTASAARAKGGVRSGLLQQPAGDRRLQGQRPTPRRPPDSRRRMG